MQENYLAKWLNGDLRDAELAEFKNSDEYASYKRIVDATDSMQAPEFNADRAYQALKNRRELQDNKVVKLRPFRKFLRVAAAAAVLVMGSYIYLNLSNETISTSYAENKEITLPDQSKVVLNADSEIYYSASNWDKKRNVDLKGEAFFKVAKGKRFTVATDAGNVIVLGTQFNVESRKGFFEVTCFEGLVSVSFNNKDTQLPAGSSFIAINGEIVEAAVPGTSVPSWMNNESSFKSVPLKYVLDEFERQHDIAVKTQNINLKQLFTGTFSNTDTDLALKSISVPSQIKFKFESDKVLFYGENTP
ncbi:FecR family protein [Pricia sp.]|uniref:FecR family protein n=1 Tax=Pricia sp. TaxID=2268138 RepID=UPI0035940FDD